MLTAAALRELYSYDPETGVFRRKFEGGRLPKGSIAGGRYASGHLVIYVERTRYFAHRLAWLYVHGEFPAGEIDHINGDPAYNRLVNLRLCDHAENTRNTKRRRDNSSGFKGVHFHKQSGKWCSQISVGGKCISLGLHPTAEAAHAAYCAAALRLHGEFARFS